MGVVICFLSYSNDVASPCFMKFSHLFMLLESHFSCLNLPVIMAFLVCVITYTHLLRQNWSVKESCRRSSRISQCRQIGIKHSSNTYFSNECHLSIRVYNSNWLFVLTANCFQTHITLCHRVSYVGEIDVMPVHLNPIKSFLFAIIMAHLFFPWNTVV